MIEEICRVLSLRLVTSTDCDFLSVGESFLKFIRRGLRSISTFTKAITFNLLTGFLGSLEFT